MKFRANPILLTFGFQPSFWWCRLWGPRPCWSQGRWRAARWARSRANLGTDAVILMGSYGISWDGIHRDLMEVNGIQRDFMGFSLVFFPHRYGTWIMEADDSSPFATLNHQILPSKFGEDCRQTWWYSSYWGYSVGSSTNLMCRPVTLDQVSPPKTPSPWWKRDDFSVHQN